MAPLSASQMRLRQLSSLETVVPIDEQSPPPRVYYTVGSPDALVARLFNIPELLLEVVKHVAVDEGSVEPSEPDLTAYHCGSQGTDRKPRHIHNLRILAQVCRAFREVVHYDWEQIMYRRPHIGIPRAPLGSYRALRTTWESVGWGEDVPSILIGAADSEEQTLDILLVNLGEEHRELCSQITTQRRYILQMMQNPPQCTGGQELFEYIYDFACQPSQVLETIDRLTIDMRDFASLAAGASPDLAEFDTTFTARALTLAEPLHLVLDHLVHHKLKWLSIIGTDLRIIQRLLPANGRIDRIAARIHTLDISTELADHVSLFPAVDLLVIHRPTKLNTKFSFGQARYDTVTQFKHSASDWNPGKVTDVLDALGALQVLIMWGKTSSSSSAAKVANQIHQLNAAGQAPPLFFIAYPRSHHHNRRVLFENGECKDVFLYAIVSQTLRGVPFIQTFVYCGKILEMTSNVHPAVVVEDDDVHRPIQIMSYKAAIRAENAALHGAPMAPPQSEDPKQRDYLD